MRRVTILFAALILAAKEYEESRKYTKLSSEEVATQVLALSNKGWFIQSSRRMGKNWTFDKVCYELEKLEIQNKKRFDRKYLCKWEGRNESI